MKYKITKNLIALGILVFSIFSANNIFAYSCSGYSCSDYSSNYGDSYNNYDYRDNYNDYNSRNYNQDRRVYDRYVSNREPVIINNYYPVVEKTTRVVTVAEPSVISPTIPVTEGKPISTIPTTSSNSNTNSSSNNTGAIEGNLLGASAYGSSGLTALSLGGSGSFMPSSIWQWIFVVILILVIIILTRIFVKKPSPEDHDHHVGH